MDFTSDSTAKVRLERNGELKLILVLLLIGFIAGLILGISLARPNKYK